jgi:hypothetical protein
MTDRTLLPLIEDSCALSPDAMEERLAQWRRALAGVTAIDRTSQAAGRLVLDLGPTVDLGELASLCALEVACCSFFAFSLTVSAEGRTLLVTVPPGAVSALDELVHLTAQAGGAA